MTTSTTSGSYSGGAPSIGTRVVTADGDELGRVQEVTGNCFKVDAPMQTDYWLASDCIVSVSDGKVRLAIDKKQVGEAKLEGPDHTGMHRHDDILL